MQGELCEGYTSALAISPLQNRRVALHRQRYSFVQLLYLKGYTPHAKSTNLRQKGETRKHQNPPHTHTHTHTHTHKKKSCRSSQLLIHFYRMPSLLIWPSVKMKCFLFSYVFDMRGRRVLDEERPL